MTESPRSLRPCVPKPHPILIAEAEDSCDAREYNAEKEQGRRPWSLLPRQGGVKRRTFYAWMASLIDWFSVWITCEKSWMA